MRVFKFGGAGICNSDRIKNLLDILRKYGVKDLLIVVSAMGKTTNKLEEILHKFLKKEDYITKIDALFLEFSELSKELFSKTHPISELIEDKKNETIALLHKYESEKYNFLYDQVVSQGELITSLIVNAYLKEEGCDINFLDARLVVKTNSDYREATVDWKKTSEKIAQNIQEEKIYLTQGFIAGDDSGYTTTLGREGSDYSAAIFAYCLDARELTIWKDVNGVLNADPRYFENANLLEQISFHEAIELAYYGASIIHPKTIQPLYNKGIPLRVRSFLNIENEGTVVNAGKNLVPDLPCYILKKNQQLLQIASRSFSFIVENDIAEIFKILHQYQMKVNLLHNSAISLSLCVDDRLGDILACIRDLEHKYKVTYIKNITLYTIRNFDEKDFSKRFGHIVPLLKQTKDEVMHFVIDDTGTVNIKSRK